MNLFRIRFGPTGFTMGGTGGQSFEGWQNTRPEATQKKPVGTPVIRVIVSLLVTLIFGAVYFFVELPALNIHNTGFYWFIILLCLVFTVCMIIMGGYRSNGAGDYIRHVRKTLPIPFAIIVIVIAVTVIGTAAGWALFRAKDYSKLLPVGEGDFTSEVSEIKWNQIPMLDEDSSNNLANRKLGELSDLVSQFTVSDSSAQINYQGNPVRVNYLNYGGFFKWWNNFKKGIPAYMTIDMRTQEVNVVRLEEGIRYSPSEYLMRDLDRHLRFSYPTFMYGDVNFEIDDEGTPYWVASVIDKKIGLFDGTDVIGAVLVNAVTGESHYYEVADVPTWVDRVYSASLLIDQYNYYGKYNNGYWNSWFGQTGCTTTTQGYNYIAQDDDVWMYTGITSVTGDRGNIGFILVNQRTKEARYYSCAGAEEYSAMSSAQGAVQQYNYQATFPLLLNISDQPTYFMALKDSAGLVKMYAMVNVQQYQIVATGYTLEECQKNYYDQLLSNRLIAEPEPDIPDEPEPEPETLTASGVIVDIRSANIDGNTIFYFQLEGGEVYYTISAKAYPIAAILNIGDEITVTYVPQDAVLLETKTLQVK
ncbi:MAG: CvpA family protein [Coprococcus sp.]